MLAAALGLGLTVPGFARDKNETIDATAWGTSTQMGHHYDVTITIYDWSTAADRQILVEAFQKGQNQGLVNALDQDEGRGAHRDHRDPGIRP